MLLKDLDNIKRERLKNDISLIRKMINEDLNKKIKDNIKHYNEMVPFKPLQIQVIQKQSIISE